VDSGFAAERACDRRSCGAVLVYGGAELLMGKIGIGDGKRCGRDQRRCGDLLPIQAAG
jgi:hypothetical protein